MNKTFLTKDFYLAAFLVTSGFNLASQKRVNGLTLFTYNDSQELQRNVSEYYSFNAKVDPLSFGNSIRALKSVIHSTNSQESNNYERRA